MRRHYRHNKIVTQISEETGIDPKVVHLIIKKFYFGLKSLLLKNEEINIKGYFKIVLSKYFKDKIQEYGKDINLRKRKNKKNYYVKKAKKS